MEEVTRRENKDKLQGPSKKLKVEVAKCCALTRRAWRCARLPKCGPAAGKSCADPAVNPSPLCRCQYSAMVNLQARASQQPVPSVLCRHVLRGDCTHHFRVRVKLSVRVNSEVQSIVEPLRLVVYVQLYILLLD